MPNHLAGDMPTWYGAKVPAVAAVYLRPAHFKGLSIIQDTMNALDEGAVAGLVKDDHITSLDFPCRKWNSCCENIIALAIVRPKAVTLNF